MTSAPTENHAGAFQSTNGGCLAGLASRAEGPIFGPMADRTRFEFELKLECPKCGKTGIAHASEDDNPQKRHPGFEVDKFPDGFKLAKYSNARHDTKVVCQCGEVFHL